MNMKSVLLNLTLVASAVAATACGDGGLDPDVTGLVNAEVHDTPAGAGAFMGTAAGNMRVSIRSTGGYLGRPGHTQWDHGGASEHDSDLGPRIDERRGRHV